MESIIPEDFICPGVANETALGQRWLLVSRDVQFVASLRVALAPLQVDLQVCEFDIEAALRFAHQTYDATLVDAQIGMTDLRQLASALKRQSSSLQVPLIVLTPEHDVHLTETCVEAGYDEVLAWPASNRLLLRKINRIGRLARLGDELAVVRGVLAQVRSTDCTAHFEWRPHPMAMINFGGLQRVLGSANEICSLTARAFLARVHPDDRHDVLRGAVQAIRRAKPLRIEFRVMIDGGLIRRLRLTTGFVAMQSGRPPRIMGQLQDVTEARISQKRIWQLANHDSLTGLPNRRHFFQKAQQLLAQTQARTGAAMVLCIHVGDMRKVNQDWGYAAGDELLLGIASRLHEPARGLSSPAQYADALIGRPVDSALAGRLDGSRFVLCLPLWSGADTTRLAQRAGEMLRLPMVVAGRPCHPQVAIGSAQSGIDGDTVEQLVARAEQAICRSQNAQNNRVVAATSGVRGLIGVRPGIERDLHRALTQGEFVLHYQPQIDARTGAIVGAEALIRWQRADQLLNPASFLDAAEAIGLMANIGEWAVAQACYQLAAWEEQGLRLPRVSVNIAAVHLERSSLAQMVVAALREHRLQADRLELEVSESGVLRKRYELMDPMQQLSNAGIRLAVDNCGTGYAAWPYLSSLPLTTLKIDRSYVGNLESSRESRAIAETIVGMARGLRLEIVAEGVESAQQMAQLLAMGCHDMQGYHFARPMDAMALLAFAGGNSIAAFKAEKNAEPAEHGIDRDRPLLDKAVA